MELDAETRTITGPAGTVKLTVRENRLLACLAEHAGEPVSRDTLLEEAWDWENADSLQTKTVDVHVGRLRRKLKEAGLDPSIIATVRNKGYRISDGARPLE